MSFAPSSLGAHLLTYLATESVRDFPTVKMSQVATVFGMRRRLSMGTVACLSQRGEEEPDPRAMESQQACQGSE